MKVTKVSRISDDLGPQAGVEDHKAFLVEIETADTLSTIELSYDVAANLALRLGRAINRRRYATGGLEATAG